MYGVFTIDFVFNVHEGLCTVICCLHIIIFHIYPPLHSERGRTQLISKDWSSLHSSGLELCIELSHTELSLSKTIKYNKYGHNITKVIILGANINATLL